MKSLLHAAVRLYPAPWRQRYAAELHALIDDMDADWRDVLNLLWGAFHMRIHEISTFPLAGGVGGAVIGVLIAASTSAGLYAATAMVHLPVRTDDAVVRITTALSDAHKNRTMVTLKERGEAGTTVQLSYEDTSAAGAEQGVRAIAAAMVASPQSAVVSAPGAARPVAPEYGTGAATGSAAGLALGVVAALVVRARRRSLAH